ncbi:MAG TPA: hypothetical protein EYG85_07595 [Crocinitomix sp.]|nr:hypothetical protein [Crocinitomix sp.]
MVRIMQKYKNITHTTTRNLIFVCLILLLLISNNKELDSNYTKHELCNSSFLWYKLYDDLKITDISHIDTCILFFENDDSKEITISTHNTVPVFNSLFLKNRKITLKSSGFGRHTTTSLFQKTYNERVYFCMVDYKENFEKVLVNLITIIKNKGTVDLTFVFENKSVKKIRNVVDTFMSNIYIEE